MTDEQTTQATPNSEENPLEKFMYHQRRAAEAGAKALAGWIPPEVRENTKEAGKEFLLSLKVLVEGATSTFEREANKFRSAAEGRDQSRPGDGPSTTGKTKVKVEVS